MARSRLSSLVPHAEPKRCKAGCYPINKSRPAGELVTPGGTIQPGGPSPGRRPAFCGSGQIYTDGVPVGVLDQQARVPHFGAGLQVALLASLRRGFLLQRDAEGLGVKGVADYKPR
jgi:hypothetical protein